MRNLFSLVIALSIVVPAGAQVHQATPLDVLLARLGIDHGSHGHSMSSHEMAMPAPVRWDGSAITHDAMPAAVAVRPSPSATSKSFNISAHQFSYDVTPSPFVVDQGDDVTLNISVPSTDGSGVGHGFFLESYMDGGVSIARGKTTTVHFVASTPGTFTYFCTVFCGEGHPGMSGVLTVHASAQTPAPAVTSISPNSGPAAGGNNVTISGSNFQTNATVSFGGTAATNVEVSSATAISAVAPAHAPGTVQVTVRNGDGQTATFDGYTYVAGPAITSISPTTGPLTGGTPLTITGSGFAAGAVVTVGGLAATNVVVVSATTITASTPSFAPTEQLGLPKDVVVTNPDGQRATLAAAFTYTLPALSVTQISPSGSAPGGGVVVTITGSGFTTAVLTTVTFGGVAATEVRVLSSTSMLVTVPAHASGTVDVKVTVGSNTVTVPNGFTYSAGAARRRAANH